MRVLLVTNLFPPDTLGGYELLAADLARSLRARGHDVQILTTTRKSTSIDGFAWSARLGARHRWIGSATLS